mmetsp:Transcript_115065/g.229128  ORF Transcript_115065/g.229128 Transcript_115065/m.229128 type:complete len:107 (-) Transcript_115065:1106-1426(-)
MIALASDPCVGKRTNAQLQTWCLHVHQTPPLKAQRRHWRQGVGSNATGAALPSEKASLHASILWSASMAKTFASRAAALTSSMHTSTSRRAFEVRSNFPKTWQPGP